MINAPGVPSRAPRLPEELDGRLYLDVDGLKARRKRMGLSQMQLAEYALDINCPLSIASIKRAESGGLVIYRTALQLARIYGVSVGSLIYYGLEPPGPVPGQEPLAGRGNY